jgi:hypothetical protein
MGMVLVAFFYCYMNLAIENCYLYLAIRPEEMADDQAC